MENNNLKNIDSKILSYYLNDTRKINLYNNPWDCSCKTFELLKFTASDINNETEKKFFTCFDSKIPLVEVEKLKKCHTHTNPLITTLICITSISSIIFGISMAAFYKYKSHIKIIFKKLLSLVGKS